MRVSTPAKAVLYTRLSVARDSSTSLAGQADDLLALAAAEGWDVVETFADNGVSGGKQRANANLALDMLRDGRADVLAVYAYDRWSRMGLEDTAPLLAALRVRREAAAKGTGAPARFVARREGLDSHTNGASDFEMRLAFAATLASGERERIRMRVTGSVNRLRKAGRFAGGTPGFGYRSAPHPTLAGRTLVAVEDEAVVVREVAERIIAGESLVKIAADLTSRGIPRSRSPYRLALLRGKEPYSADGEELARGQWDQSRVRDLWLSEHLLGRVIVKGAALLDAGQPAQPFPAILDLATHQRIKGRFEGVKRGHQRKRRASHLLSGLVYCDGCAGRMYPRSYGADVYFGCSASARGVVCPLGHPRIKADIVEDVVLRGFLRRFGHVQEVIRDARTVTDTAARLGDVQARITETTARLTRRDADRGELLQCLDDLLDEKERLESLPDEVAVTYRATGRTVAEAWAIEGPVDVHRDLLAAWVDHVRIRAAATRGRVVDYRRVLVEWTPEAEAQ